ncbi:MAG: Bax inhibitor-1/YccA family protein [Verrucomicrobiota bacterium]
MYRTSNPALNDEVFSKQPALANEPVMTLQGTVNKTFILTTLLAVAGSFGWKVAESGSPLTMPVMIGGGILALILVIVSCFKPQWAPAIAPSYAILKGAAIGIISFTYNARFNGIVLQAALLTLGILFALLLAYQSRMIRATENFKLGIVAATGGIFLFYLVTLVLGFFGVSVPLVAGNGVWAIGFSVFVVIIAALNLVLDFDFIENGVEMRAAKYMEWQAALGLLVTLVWLYIEILRLLAKLRSRD